MENYADDQALLARLRAADERAFRTVNARYFRLVASHAFQQGASQADAEDLFQDTLFVLIKKARDPHFQLTAQLGTYLFSVAKNLWAQRLDRLRREPSRPSSGLFEGDRADDFEGEAAFLETEKQLERVAEKFESLEADCQKVLLLSFFEKKSQAEIAAEMGYSEAFVKVKKHRCMSYLRKAVAP